MINEKLTGYLGFAAKAGKLRNGYNTTISLINKGRARLVLIAEDAAEGTKDKISSKCVSAKVKHIIYGDSSSISKAVGCADGTVFAVTYKGFADVISKEIDRIRSEGETS